MTTLSRVVFMAAIIAVLGVVLSFVATRPVTAAPAPQPTLIVDVDNPGRHPFAVSASCSNPSDVGGCVANPSFPSTTVNGEPVKTVVIDFVSTICTGLAAGTTDEQDNFNFGFTLGGQVNAVYFPVVVDPNGTARLAQQTSIYADPGSASFIGTPGNNSGCVITVTGHLIPQ